LNAQGQLGIAVVHRMDGLTMAVIGLGQHDLKAAAANVFVGHEVRQADDALPGQRQLSQRLAAGSDQRRPNGPVFALGMAQGPLVD
jgi:hypothetical protein